MLYILWMVILGGHNIKKKNFRKTSIFELSKVKNCGSKLCTSPFIHSCKSLLVETVISRLWHGF